LPADVQDQAGLPEIGEAVEADRELISICSSENR
jgi:hypothetical protein